MKNLPSELHYRRIEIQDEPLVQTMILAFYQGANNEQSPGDANGMTNEKVTRTFQQFQRHPETGTILVIEYRGEIIGYSILINFWSNEYGGNILIIDELYLMDSFRGKGIGEAFIRYLIKHRYNHWVGMELEVLPYNVRALQLYEKVGFRKSDRSYLLFFE